MRVDWQGPCALILNRKTEWQGLGGIGFSSIVVGRDVI